MADDPRRSPATQGASDISFDQVHRTIQELRDRVGRSVVGYDEAIDDLLTAYMTDGHVLMEGVPGLAKTTLAKAFTAALGLEFHRVQFTQDVLPADITGHFFFNRKDSSFEFRQGPIFANVVLADEINRASAKTQSALLEAMQERQVTVEGQTFELPSPFFVIATQNPVDVEGVYTLPLAQLDRFMLKTTVDYLPRAGERSVLERELAGQIVRDPDPAPDTHIATDLRAAYEMVHVDGTLLDYVLDIMARTREHEDLRLGASTRAALHLLRASQAKALIEGRQYVIPDDVKQVGPEALGHRLTVTVDAELEQRHGLDVLADVLDEVPVPQVERQEAR